MAWIKRNLYFVIGAAVAVLLLGLAAYYCYSKWELNNENLGKLEAAYADWERIINLNPSPGNQKNDNIKLARAQQKEVHAEIQKVHKYFVDIPSVPNPSNGPVTKEGFASALRVTIDELQKLAENNGVTLPPRYDFSFQAERNLPTFAPNSLRPLSTQLGDLKVICSIVFKAKVNSLESLRRERISTDDMNGPQADYLELGNMAVTNSLGVLMPYEISFRCFSAELGDVLSGFANNPHGIIVKSVNVEPGTGSALTPGQMGEGGYGYQPGVSPPPEYEQRGYGRRGYVPPGYRGYGRPEVAPAAPVTRNGLQTVLDEEPLKVTLLVNTVKLLPKK
jgi:hypothetical protein